MVLLLSLHENLHASTQTENGDQSRLLAISVQLAILEEV
jgi:hypothetical protein